MTTVFMTKGTYIFAPIPRRVKFRLLGHVILCLDMASKFKKETNIDKRIHRKYITNLNYSCRCMFFPSIIYSEYIHQRTIRQPTLNCEAFHKKLNNLFYIYQQTNILYNFKAF
ncbi:hypothetical protein QTP88_012968 [Uroleucon formosanum]